MVLFVVFLSTLLLSITIIRLFSPIAVNIGLVDKPGGHKQHQGNIPVVGGIAIYLSVLIAWVLLPLLGVSTMNAIFLASSGLLFMTGLLDDRFTLSVKVRMFMQIVAALLLVYSNVILYDFGYLLSDELFTTGVFAIPLTVLATVGVINSLNMIDGVDGLAGLVSVVIVSLLLFVSIITGSTVQALISVCIQGSVVGFLIFNMRRPGFKKAKVFMGDAGSTLLGFMFAYLLISLSQGEGRVISPVTALWLFALPLMDTLGVMMRRIWQKKSPFSADTEHFHHLLMDAGFRVRHIVYFIATLQLILGIIGLIFFYLDIHESISFITFLIVFVLYTVIISRPWRTIPILRALHRSADLTVRGTQHIYVGMLNKESAVSDINAILGGRVGKNDYCIYEGINEPTGKSYMFAVINVNDTDKVKKVVRYMKNRKHNHKDKLSVISGEIDIRQYIIRNQVNDRRKNNHNKYYMCKRRIERRGCSLNTITEPVVLGSESEKASIKAIM
jgi:undecaprenyl-phosphate alpha-N-acetylglucosaminyl 1-phosphatetransferase